MHKCLSLSEAVISVYFYENHEDTTQPDKSSTNIHKSYMTAEVFSSTRFDKKCVKGHMNDKLLMSCDMDNERLSK